MTSDRPNQFQQSEQFKPLKPMKDQFYSVPFYRGWSLLHEVLLVFHQLCGNKHNRFAETLSLGDKFLGLGRKSLSLEKKLEFCEDQ